MSFLKTICSLWILPVLLAVLPDCFAPQEHILAEAGPVPTATALYWELNDIEKLYPSRRLAEVTLVYARAVEPPLPPELLASVVEGESGWDSLSVNPGDPSYGLGNVMPRHWEHVFVGPCGSQATPTSLMRADVGMCYTAFVLSHYINKFGLVRGLNAYNNGQGRSSSYATNVLSRLVKYQSQS